MRGWPFAPYDKIQERLDLDEAAHRALAKVPWLVTEKIHGANLCLLSDGTEVRAAKRKVLLNDGDEFFGWKAIAGRFAPAVRALHTEVARAHPDATHVLAYGELFGGAYPHPAVAPVDGVEPVQTGVWYAPGIEWLAFDVGIAVDGEIVLLDWDEAERALTAAGVPFAPPRFTGKMNEVLAFPLGFTTGIPELLGLPPIPDNYAEGIVAKPLRAVVVDEQRLAPRIKRKIDEFAEDQRFHGAQKWGQPPRHAASASEALLAAARAKVNEPRLHAARSKIGRVRRDDQRRRAELERAILDEVLDEVANERPKDWGRLSVAERDRVRATVAIDVSALVQRTLR